VEILRYPIPMSLTVEYVENGRYSVDSEGIPYVKYGHDIGDRYNPATISQYALGLWEMAFNESDPQKSRYLKAFLDQVAWLRSNSLTRNGSTVWTYDFDFPSYSLRSGWISALAQGQVASVLLRSSTLDNKGDLDLATRACLPFQRSIEEGGVLTHTPEGFPWFEEYPSAAPSLVLNGFVFALFAIWELHRVTKKPQYCETWQDGIACLKETTHFYDSGFWCYYDRYKERPHRTLIPDHYMRHVYIPQFEALHELTGDFFFKECALRWKKYCESRTSSLLRKLLPKLRRAGVPRPEKTLELMSRFLQVHRRQ
jgi:heparosan-N-sulfate-glucuronate 5-epimerase